MGSGMRSLRTWFWRRVLAYTDRCVQAGAGGWRVRLRNHAWRKVCHRLCCDHVDYGDVCHGCPLRAAVTKPVLSRAVSHEPQYPLPLLDG